jgi:2'-5' RNA ligase
LFVAVDVGPALEHATRALVAELRRRLETVAPGTRVTWVVPNRLHLTIRFIGEADAGLAGTVIAALDRPLARRRFAMTIGGIGAFPTTSRPRALWVGARSDDGGLRWIEQEVTARLRGVGVAPEGREFRPHITLARVRNKARLRVGPLLEGLTDSVLGTTWVEAITLFESRLTQKGPEHVPLRVTPLAP